LLDDLEVLDVGDESVLVRVYALEDELSDVGGEGHPEELVGEVDEVDELGEGELVLRAVGDALGAVLALQTHLPAVPLEEEVAQLHEGHCPAVVNVHLEKVLKHVVPLSPRLLLQHIHDEGVQILSRHLSTLVLVLVKMDLQISPDVVFQSHSCLLHFPKDMY
jgi:hypothetical protein